VANRPLTSTDDWHGALGAGGSAPLIAECRARTEACKIALMHRQASARAVLSLTRTETQCSVCGSGWRGHRHAADECFHANGLSI
jgi:hypothetical protein